MFLTKRKSVSMPPRYPSEGEIVDDTHRNARLAAHLNSKKAGPLVCPICKATESFEAKGTLAGSRPDPLPSMDLPAPADPQLSYATCTNCGYAIFFDAGALSLPE